MRPRLPAAHRVGNPEGHAALEHITPHRQLRVLLAQPRQLRALALAQLPVPALPAAPVSTGPVPQGPRVHPQVPGHLRDPCSAAHRAAANAYTWLCSSATEASPARISAIGSARGLRSSAGSGLLPPCNWPRSSMRATRTRQLALPYRATTSRCLPRLQACCYSQRSTDSVNRVLSSPIVHPIHS